ncbi:MAG TPA: BON domain-containing protein [Nitrospiraceae bacterium]|nr:BON domain-containing protein [Nitrospiraceae bacterium]
MTAYLSLVLVLWTSLMVGFKGAPDTVPDPDIQAAVKQRLAMDGRIEPGGVEVRVEDGTVTLSGIVETLQEKLLADNLVVSTQGVKAVRNTIRVKPTPTKDDAIERAVEETLKTVPALKNKPLHVSVSQGVVTLKGSVEKQVHSLAAEKAAQTVPGVADVVNLIKVVGAPRPDREIERDLVFYLQSSSLVNLDDVDYRVTDGTVTLKGHIDNLSHKYAIASDVEKIHGVRSVDARGLTVKSSKGT